MLIMMMITFTHHQIIQIAGPTYVSNVTVSDMFNYNDDDGDDDYDDNEDQKSMIQIYHHFRFSLIKLQRRWQLLDILLPYGL